MEINKVADLLPYQRSLQELWTKEEFQPVLKLCDALRREAIEGLKTLELRESFAISIKVASLKTQINFSDLILQLPQMLKAIEAEQVRIQQKKQAFADSQEGGTL